MRKGVLLVFAAPLLAALPAQAQSDPVASSLIASGAYDKAEQTLLAELRIHPGRPELLLNLAAVYANTGRASQARMLYREVLSREEVLMDLRAERTLGSHAVAQAGLRRIESVQFTSR